MILIVTVLHILVCMALVFVVLLQKGSGADMGAAFGGSSQSLFGARGSGDFLSKITAGLATVFMITSLTLAFFSTRPGVERSVMDGAPVSSTAQPEKGKDGAATKDASKEKEAAPESGPPVPAKSAPKKPADVSGEITAPAKPVPTPPEAKETPAAKKPEPAKDAEKKSEPVKKPEAAKPDTAKETPAKKPEAAKESKDAPKKEATKETESKKADSAKKESEATGSKP
ncbi:MAG: preprotein translocase subunit SecG [Magnetococcales bacterium]|nr:preprotein translocase subunit SecG [Magnetococcales bacterium]